MQDTSAVWSLTSNQRNFTRSSKQNRGSGLSITIQDTQQKQDTRSCVSALYSIQHTFTLSLIVGVKTVMVLALIPIVLFRLGVLSFLMSCKNVHFITCRNKNNPFLPNCFIPVCKPILVVTNLHIASISQSQGVQLLLSQAALHSTTIEITLGRPEHTIK